MSVPTWQDEPDPYANQRHARRAILDDLRRKVANWQRQHPGQDVPAWLDQRAAEAARRLAEVENRG